MARPVPTSMSAYPTIADGWRVVQDPEFPMAYWRCRALVIEWNSWAGGTPDGWLFTEWSVPGISDQTWTPAELEARRELFADLFVRP